MRPDVIVMLTPSLNANPCFGPRPDPESAAGPTPLYGCGIGVVCGFEFQPGALGILLQQAQPLQATACTLANQVNQILQLTFIRRPDALELRGPVVAIDIYAIQEQDVKMYIEVEG